MSNEKSIYDAQVTCGPAPSKIRTRFIVLANSCFNSRNMGAQQALLGTYFCF